MNYDANMWVNIFPTSFSARMKIRSNRLIKHVVISNLIWRLRDKQIIHHVYGRWVHVIMMMALAYNYYDKQNNNNAWQEITPTLGELQEMA